MFRYSRRAPLLLLLLLPVAGCNYGLTSAGGFPSDVKTIFIAPLDNRTVKFELNEQVARELNERLPRALGVRLAGEDVADAVVRGEITGYSDVAQNYRPGDQGAVQVLSHQVQVSMALRIVDVKRNAYIWEGTSITGRGEYRPDTQTDEVARLTAVRSLIQQIIDGAQSQW
jgi:hypothetical protein